MLQRELFDHAGSLDDFDRDDSTSDLKRATKLGADSCPSQPQWRANPIALDKDLDDLERKADSRVLSQVFSLGIPLAIAKAETANAPKPRPFQTLP